VLWTILFLISSLSFILFHVLQIGQFDLRFIINSRFILYANAIGYIVWQKFYWLLMLMKHLHYSPMGLIFVYTCSIRMKYIPKFPL
jgi:hypothetical protein